MTSISTEHRRALLASRQLLGSTGRDDRTIADVVDQLGLLHSTDPSTPYLSIHARSEASVAEVDRAYYAERQLLRHTTIRRTVFTMSPTTFTLAHHSTNGDLVAKLRKQLIAWLDRVDDLSTSGADYLDRVEAEVVAFLGSSDPTPGQQLAEEVPGLQTRVDPMPGKSYSKPIRITSKVLEILAAEGRIIRDRPTGNDFTSAAWTWTVPTDALIGPLDPPAALAGLIGQHLTAFTPSTVTDLTWWAGSTKTKVRRALEALGAVAVDLEDASEPGFVLPDDDLAVDQDEAVALLPGLDSTTMGWKQRSWYVDDEAAAGLFDRNGNAGPTIWVGGRVVGTWTQRESGAIVTHLTDDVSQNEAARIAEEADRTQTWLGDVRVKWRYPTSLTKQLAG